MRFVCALLFIVVQAAACTPSGATGTSADQARVDPKAACPPGTQEDTSTEAMTDCQGKAGANVMSKSGTISGHCLNKGSSTVKCVSDPTVCGTAGISSITATGVTCNTPAPKEAAAKDGDCVQRVDGNGNVVYRRDCVVNRH